MSLRSPLGRVLGLGSAKGGSSHWYAQRVSAIAVTVLGLWFLCGLLSLDGAGYAAVIGWLQAPLAGALAAVLVAVLAWHAMLGVQVVIEDYVADHGVRMLVLLGVKFALVAAAVIGVLAVLRIGFGVNG